MTAMATCQTSDGCSFLAAEYSPFYAIEKGAVLQEARCFNDPHIDSRRCQQVVFVAPLPKSLCFTASMSHPLGTPFYISENTCRMMNIEVAVQVITKLLYLLTQGETLTKACSILPRMLCTSSVLL